jgi:hypothetical protein
MNNFTTPSRCCRGIWIYLNDFKANRSKIVQWLTFLKQNCPTYHDIRIDADALSQLPEDGNVLDDILTMDDDLDGSDAGDSRRGVGRQ